MNDFCKLIIYKIRSLRKMNPEISAAVSRPSSKEKLDTQIFLNHSNREPLLSGLLYELYNKKMQNSQFLICQLCGQLHFLKKAFSQCRLLFFHQRTWLILKFLTVVGLKNILGKKKKKRNQTQVNILRSDCSGPLLSMEFTLNAVTGQLTSGEQRELAVLYPNFHQGAHFCRAVSALQVPSNCN